MAALLSACIAFDNAMFALYMLMLYVPWCEMEHTQHPIPCRAHVRTALLLDGRQTGYVRLVVKIGPQPTELQPNNGTSFRRCTFHHHPRPACVCM
uniref:Putative secreted protein n=1 Tax=Anopheles marajoara TaxID=58244 RepID=A0A2M4CAD5_9DIPT